MDLGKEYFFRDQSERESQKYLMITCAGTRAMFFGHKWP